jgi:hypothetical protein
MAYTVDLQRSSDLYGLSKCREPDEARGYQKAPEGSASPE